MSWLVDPATRALTTALDGYARRELAIASNLANIDTPGFKPARVDFEAELAAATADGIAGGGLALNPPTAGPTAAQGLARTSESHLAGLEAAAHGSGSIPLSSVAPGVSTRIDGNAVDVEAQMTSLAETQLKYAAVSRMLTGKLQQLKDVVQAR
jgi:flagellar basal-body rod protein FlgB